MNFYVCRVGLFLCIHTSILVVCACVCVCVCVWCFDLEIPNRIITHTYEPKVMSIYGSYLWMLCRSLLCIFLRLFWLYACAVLWYTNSCGPLISVWKCVDENRSLLCIYRCFFGEIYTSKREKEKIQKRDGE